MRKLSSAIALVLLTGCSGRASPPAPDPETPAAAVQKLLELRVPIGGRMSPDDRRRVAEVEANPQPYVDALRVRFAAEPPSEPAEHAEWLRQLGVAAHLMAVSRSSLAPEVLEAWYLGVAWAQVETSGARVDGEMRRVRAGLLELLGGMPCRPRVADSILPRLAGMDPQARVGATAYLVRSCRDAAAIVSRLRALHDDPASPLYHDEKLGTQIQSIGSSP